MLWFCYHRDRLGSTPLRRQMAEEHWSYMDQFVATMIARGPTFTDDGTLTGSVHILDLPSPEAARAFAFDEPGYQAGAYRDVLLRRWHNTLGRTMWEFRAGRPDHDRYLVLGFAFERAAEAAEAPQREELIASGPLLSDDGSLVLGAAVLLEAPDTDRAAEVLPPNRYTGIEVHRWRFGGRPDQDR
ncbi:MAG: YciI family protein [Dermatophilaceae bacterium]